MRINLICNNSQYSASDLEVESTATVAELRRRIQTRTGLSRAAADSSRLLHTGRLLTDSNTLDHSNVHDGSTIHMVLAPANQSTSANTGSSSSSMPFGSSNSGTSSTAGGFTGPGGANGPQMTFSFGGGSGSGPAPPFPFPPGFMPPGANSGEMVINFMDGDPNVDVQSIMNSIGNMISTQLPGVVPGGVNVGVTSNVNGTPFSQSWTTTTSSGSTSPASTTTTPTTTPPTTSTTASSTTNAPASHTTTPPPAPASAPAAPAPTPATNTSTPQPHITAHIRTHAVPSSGPFNFMSSVLPTSGTNASTTTNNTVNANANVGVGTSNLAPSTHMPMMENTHTSAALPSYALHNVHVHVHCTMDELEVLPERIARLSQRMQPSRPSVFQHMMAIPRPNAPGGGHATSNQQSQPQPQQHQPQNQQQQQQSSSSSSSLGSLNSLFESISSQMPQILSLSVSVGIDMIMSLPKVKESMIRAYKYVKEIVDKHETSEYLWSILSQREHNMEFFNAVHSFCQNNLTSEQMTRLKPKMTRLMCHFVGQVGEIVLQQEQSRTPSTSSSSIITPEEENVIVDKMKPIVKKFVACAMLLIKNEQPRIVELIKELFTQQAQSLSASMGGLNTSAFVDRIWSAVGTLVSQDQLEQLLSHPYNGSALSRLDRFMSCDHATNESTSLSEATDGLPEEDHISNISSSHHTSHTQAEQNDNNNNDDDDLLDSLANELLEQEDQSSNVQSSAQNSSLPSSELKDALEEWSSAVNASEATRSYISRLLDISL